MTYSDVTPTYRGYRLQQLYVLYRVLQADAGADVIFQPEGLEDLAILDTQLNVIEIVQVKALTHDLVLSDFHPGQRDAFFARVADQIALFPDISIKVVSYGGVGPELTQAVGTTAPKQEAVVKKIQQAGAVSPASARLLLTRTEIVQVSEGVLTDTIMDILKHHPTGINPAFAFDFLLHWIYRCAEAKRKFTYSEVLERLHRTGQYLAEARAHHDVWFKSVFPIEDSEPSSEKKAALADAFYKGVSAEYVHVLAGLDMPREEKIAEINKKFQKSNVVIVHGASGQGKSTLAYRYMHDTFPEHFRFEIPAIWSIDEAHRVALALSGHAGAIGMPIGVFVDVTTTTAGWQALVKRLSSVANLNVLVAIREEEWRRAAVTDYEFHFDSVELVLHKEEAESIYNALVQHEASTRFVSFENAWRQFGEEGPLLEFVYLVKQGDTLHKVLKGQVVRLQDEVREGKLDANELELLRLVAVASAFEARLKLEPLMDHLKLKVPDRSLDLFEKEYHLLTVTPGRSFISGLHPLRSEILTGLLTNTATIRWSDIAATCLHFIKESDVESFLLYSASRRQNEAEQLLQALATYQPTTWEAVLGVIRALLWLGVGDYLRENSGLLEELLHETYDRWWLIVNVDIAAAMEDGMSPFWETFSYRIPEENRRKLTEWRSRQSDKQHVFRRAAAWIASRTDAPQVPCSLPEWVAFAEANCWIGSTGVDTVLTSAHSSLDFEDAIESLPVEVVADVVAGLHASSPDIVEDINYQALQDKFKKETYTPLLKIEGDVITAHFIIYPFDSWKQSSQSPQETDTKTKHSVAAEGTRCIGLMRRLFPTKEYYATYGYGHKLVSAPLPYDESHRKIKRQILPLRWLPSLNGIFIELGTKPLRPDDWPAYATAIMGLRMKSLGLLKKLHYGLELHFRKENIATMLGDILKSGEWDSCKLALTNSPLLPKCALDEWGLVRESQSKAADDKGKSDSLPQTGKANLALNEYRSYLHAMKEFITPMTNFFNQGHHTIVINSMRGRNRRSEEEEKVLSQHFSSVGLNEDFVRLSTFNLNAAWKSLNEMQRQFRALLSPYIAVSDLLQLEQEERGVYRRVWCMWYYYAFHYRQRIPDAARYCEGEFTEIAAKIKRSLRKNLKAITVCQALIISDDAHWDGKVAIWVNVNSNTSTDLHLGCSKVIEAMSAAIQSVGPIELRRYALELTWEFLVIVPTVQGRSVDGTAWHLPMYVLEGNSPFDEMGWWNYMRHSIPGSAVESLGILRWNHPRLAVGESLVRSIAILSLYAEHIDDLNRLPDDEDSDQSILDAYLTGLIEKIAPVAQEALSTLGEIQDYINQTLVAKEVILSRPGLCRILATLLPLQEKILMDSYTDGRLHLDSNGITQWAESLRDARSQAVAINSYWIEDVLKEISETSKAKSG